uniref:Uncharacterized protein n=1 Tax=Solanum lycopersicum TaxID=4081 RepID=A0A3Q7EDX2_SOLLC
MCQMPDAMKPKGDYKDIPLQIKFEGAEIWLTRAKQENGYSKEISNLDLDDNKEDPLPLVSIMTYKNVQGGMPLQITETGAKFTVNKAHKLFVIYYHKVRQQLVDNKVVDSLWKRSDPLILDGTILMHNHIFINFSFDPAQLKQSVEIANEFDLLVIIDGVDTKINACLIVANFSSHHYFKEDNFSLNESNHVRQYCLYHIPGAFGAYFDSSSTLDDIIVIKV